MQINEIHAEKILGRTKISLAEYVINHYTGCQYSCVYCYARYLKRSIKRGGWGEYVDVKINAPQLLEKELTLIKPASVMLGSITEVYQPIEKKYRITEQLLEILAAYKIPVVILTRSNLILRDLKILKKLPKISVFFTVTADDSTVSDLFENNTPDYQTRLAAIKELRANNINVWAHIGPIIPYFTDTIKIINDLKNTVSKIEFESLNATTAPIDIVVEKLKQIDKIKAEKISELYKNADKYSEYWEIEKNKILKYCENENTALKTHFSFPPLTEYF